MTTKLDWARAEDEAWADRVRWQLATAHGGNAALINRVLAEAQEACAESGEPAREIFGDADAYAAEVARERVPDEVRAQVDLDGAEPGERWRHLALAVGAPGIVLCLVVWFTEGWSAGVDPAGLALLVTVTLGWAAVAWGGFERHAGHLRHGWVLWGVAAAVVAGGVAVTDQLRDRAPLGAPAVLVPLVAFVALVALSSRLPAGRRPEPDFADLPADEWFDRLTGLLRGRYYLSRAAVARQVSEAREYWRESGAAHPVDEFGAPHVYALRLVRGSRAPRTARRRVEAWGYTAIAALWGWNLAHTVAAGEGPGQIGWRLLGFSVFAVSAWLAWRPARVREV